MIHLSRREVIASAASAALGGGPQTQLRAAMPPVTGVAHKDLIAFDKLFTALIDEHKIPGAAVAITRQGRLVYARGFGYADVEKKTAVEPNALFRIASVSKPITAAGVLLLVQRGKMNLDDSVLKHLTLKAALPPGGIWDTRWEKVTIRHCLQHTGGWDRDKTKGVGSRDNHAGYDPIGFPERIKRALKLDGPPSPDDIVRYMMGQPLDFAPGAKMVYSNLGYLVLGRAIETVTGQKYEQWMRANVLAPIAIRDMALARAVPEKRPRMEARYYDGKGRTGSCLYPPRAGLSVPLPDGGENIESFEAHGGWIASAIDLVRFASAFDDDRKSPLLSAETRREMWARPEGSAGYTSKKKPRDSYYACGWEVQPIGNAGKQNTWHAGLIAGTSALLVRRFDGLNWAVLFNTDTEHGGTPPADLIDAPMHTVADAIRKWPERDLFDL
jgi:N-acyl-D-amino-acid deacylase